MTDVGPLNTNYIKNNMNKSIKQLDLEFSIQGQKEIGHAMPTEKCAGFVTEYL